MVVCQTFLNFFLMYIFCYVEKRYAREHAGRLQENGYGGFSEQFFSAEEFKQELTGIVQSADTRYVHTKNIIYHMQIR